MPRFLVATASRATTKAACNYLRERLEAGDEVYVLTVQESAGEQPDVGLQEARTHLAESAEVRTLRREGTPSQVIVTYARRDDIDEVIVGPHAGGGGAAGIGSTTRAVLRSVDKPVFVVGL